MKGSFDGAISRIGRHVGPLRLVRWRVRKAVAWNSHLLPFRVVLLDAMSNRPETTLDAHLAQRADRERASKPQRRPLLDGFLKRKLTQWHPVPGRVWRSARERGVSWWLCRGDQALDGWQARRASMPPRKGELCRRTGMMVLSGW